MLKLPFFTEQKFIMIIGDDGAVLSLINQNKLISKLFAASAAPADRREMNALLLKYPATPIFVLLDSIEQTYTKQVLPAVSAMNIGKLVKRRMDRDFAKTDIKGAVLMGRDTGGRKDWIYMFVSTPATPAILSWLEYFNTLQNSLASIQLLPVEMENVVKDLNKALWSNTDKKCAWQFIVTHNKTGGFRQTVLNNNKVVFTRLIRQGKDSLPDIIAGNIEQEIINTIDYLRRLGLGDDEPIDVFVIAAKELKQSLATTKIRGKLLLSFTPHDISKMLNIETTSGKDDKFADTLLAIILARHKPILKLANPKAKTLNTLLLANKLATIAMITIMPILIIYCGYLIINILGISNRMKQVENTKAATEKEWKDIKNTGDYNIDDANKITDAMSLRKKIAEERQNPIDFIAKLAQMNSAFITLQSLTWNYDKAYATQGSKAKINAILNIEFIIKGGSIEGMFQNYDILAGQINKEYSNYTIDMSKLPDKITFDDKTENLPIQIKFTSKDLIPGAPPPPTGGQ